MKQINLYARGLCKLQRKDRLGIYIIAMEYKGKCKIIRGYEFNTTGNRILITGLTAAVKMLKEPCNINLYIHTPLGFKKTKTNGDLMDKLKNEIMQGGHELEEIISHKNQEKLIELTRIYFKEIETN